MKKITLLVFVFLTSLMSYAQFNEDFEGTWTTGSGPAGWAIINVAGPTRTWVQASGGLHSLPTPVLMPPILIGKPWQPAS